MTMEDCVARISCEVHNIKIDVGKLLDENNDISDDEKIILLKKAYDQISNAEKILEKVIK